MELSLIRGQWLWNEKLFSFTKKRYGILRVSR